MQPIHFQTEVGADNSISIPDGVTLPPGPVDVTIVARSEPELPARENYKSVWEWLLAMGLEAEKIESDLPADLAENHDFYAHGKPRQ